MEIQPYIRDTIKQDGHKMTAPRIKISNFLTKHEGLFCAHDIKRIYKKMDKASIYRTLDLFSKLSLIQPVTSRNGQQYYELYIEKDHHHHIVCTKCNRTECVSCMLRIPTIKQFSHIAHTLVLTGICASCNS